MQMFKQECPLRAGDLIKFVFRSQQGFDEAERYVDYHGFFNDYTPNESPWYSKPSVHIKHDSLGLVLGVKILNINDYVYVHMLEEKRTFLFRSEDLDRTYKVVCRGGEYDTK